MLRKTAVIYCLVVSAAAEPARAEVYECDGKWTNKPCSGTITKSIEEAGSSAPVDPAAKLIREKTSLLHDLRMRAIQAKERYDLRVDISDVEELCLKKPTSIEECGKKVELEQIQLDKRIAAAGAVAAQERSIELQEEANRLQEQQNEIEANKPNITVIEEDRPIIVVPRDRPGHINPPVIVIPDPDVRPKPGPNQGVVVYDNHGNPTKLQGVKPGPFAPRKAPYNSREGERDHSSKCR